MNRDQHTAEAVRLARMAEAAIGAEAMLAYATLADVHARLAALATIPPVQPAPPGCDERSIDGSRCLLRPGHSEPHRMGAP